jgi:aspartate ammonia-lyase
MPNAEFRTESDDLGELQIPALALHGIHTQRSLGNFNLAGVPVHPQLIHAYGQVKLACAMVNDQLSLWPRDKADAIRQACGDAAAGRLDEHVRVDALQGGAGTSLNMNMN